MKSFEEMLEFGEQGERFVARKLMECGMVVANHFQYKAKASAPGLFRVSRGRISKMVIPDLQAWDCKGSRWLEVKRKTAWVPRKGGFETGTEERLFREYERVQDSTKCPVVLLFAHEIMAPTGLYFITLDACRKALAEGKGVRLWDGCHDKTKQRVMREPMVMICRELLTRWCDFKIDEEAS
jgi:hypothetical protein